MTFSVSQSFSTNVLTNTSLTLTGNDPTTATYYVELDDITSSPGTKLGSVGPGTLGASALLSFLFSSLNPQTLQAGHNYVFTYYYIPAGVPTPSPAPTLGANACTSNAAPVTASQTYSAGKVTLAMPAVGGCSASVALTSISTSGTANLTSQVTAPSGLASPPATGSAAPFTPVAYFSAAFSSAVTQTDDTTPAVTFTIPSVGTGVSFYVGQWITTSAGSQFTGYLACGGNTAPPLTASGNSLTLATQTCSSANFGTLPAGSTLTYALVYNTSGTALPAGATCTSGASSASTNTSWGTGTITWAFPASGGCSANLVMSGSATSDSATLTTQVTAPGSLAAPPSQVLVGVAFFAVSFTSLEYELNQPASIQGTITVPSINAATRTFYLAAWGEGHFDGYVNDCNGNPVPLTVSGNTLSLPATACTPESLAVGNGLVITYGLVYVPTGSQISALPERGYSPTRRMTSIAMSGLNALQFGQ